LYDLCDGHDFFCIGIVQHLQQDNSPTGTGRRAGVGTTTLFADVSVFAIVKHGASPPATPTSPFFPGPKKDWTKKGPFPKADSALPTRFQNSLIAYQYLLYQSRVTRHQSLRLAHQRSNS